MAESDHLRQTVRDRVNTASRAFHQPGESRVKRWFLFDGDRKYVAGVLLLGVLVSLLLLGSILPIEYRDLLEETTMVQTVFNTLLSGVILLVSIAVSVVAVGISQELTTLGEQTDRVNTAIEYRDKIELRDDIDASPAQPGQFLAVMLQTILQRADELETIAEDQSDAEFQTEVDRLAQDIHMNAVELLDTLDRIETGSTDELLVGLDYDCSWQLYQTRRLLTEHGEQLSDPDRRIFESLVETLRYFLIGREYFKSLYYKNELSDLSTVLLSVSLPVIVFITYILLALDAGLFPEFSVLGFTPFMFFISLGYTIALAPYLVFTAFIFRAASVTKRTMAAGPFMLDTKEQS